jgi:hypothetical protein
MKYPQPRPGLVLRGGFDWALDESRRTEPAPEKDAHVIIVAARRQRTGAVWVTVASIDSAPPADPVDAIAMAPADCERLGLAHVVHWLRFDRLGRFTWPGLELTPAPAPGPDQDGLMASREMYEAVRRAILVRQNARAADRPSGAAASPG